MESFHHVDVNGHSSSLDQYGSCNAVSIGLSQTVLSRSHSWLILFCKDLTQLFAKLYVPDNVFVRVFVIHVTECLRFSPQNN